ncbi:hypothetical protein MHYP_G00101570 [Metynnis hypsauchen]
MTFDPCSVYSVLDNDWRRPDTEFYTNYGGFDDTLVEWSGWYRLYLQGKSAQIAESDWCWSFMTCGGYTALLLGGSHPRPQDGIVTREIYGTNGSEADSKKCSSYRSNPIQVKACPGNYYVYRLVKPAVSIPMPTYCAAAFNALSYDPCYNYTALDQPWRATNATGLWICDRYFNWNGWYRLLYYGMSVRMPESCVDQYRCGTDVTLWLNGSHPQIEDGIVTRGVCGNVRWDCCYYRSIPIRVKACPGNYYVYEFVRPVICDSAYCADVNTTTSTSTTAMVTISPELPTTPTDIANNMTFDPCSVYSVLDNDWRRPDSGYYTNYGGFDDTLVEWSGWYRLYLQGQSAQIPESDWCWSSITCGGYTALLLGGSHPRPQDGIVTRDVYGTSMYSFDSSQCNSYRSNPIQVKACPGNYYVYRLVKPAVSIPMPTYCAVAIETPSYDPCNNYTSLDQPWRGTNETGGYNCDYCVDWNGWYRLLYNGMNIRMPDSCVDESRCGTDVTLWLNGSHPQIEDGIVTRGVCGNVGWDCCFRRSIPIRVKACPGNYYIYEFVRPVICDSAYCADVNTITSTSTTAMVTISPELPTTPIQTITLSPECQGNFTEKCAEKLFNQIRESPNPVLPPEIVKKVLQEQVLNVEVMNADQPVSTGNTVLKKIETLVSTLVKPTETTDSVKISLKGLEFQVFAVGPKASLTEFPQLSINNAQMDIDLVQVSKNNNGSAAVAFMSYANMARILKPSLFSTTNSTVKTMMSNVISATLPKSTNTQLKTPVNFTLEHIAVSLLSSS